MRPGVGDIVRIDLLDHVEDGDGAMPLTVVGRVVAQDDQSITVDSWMYTDEKAERDHNMKSFTVVRGAIEGVWALQRGPALDFSPPRKRGGRRA